MRNESIIIKEVSLYDENGNIVLANANGDLTQQLSDSSYTTLLNLSGGEVLNKTLLNKDKIYYAIGLKDNDVPVRTELVHFLGQDYNGAFRDVIDISQQQKKDESLLGGGAGGDMSMRFSNYSTTEFELAWKQADLQYGFGGLTTSPSPILKANAGMTSMGASQFLSTLDEGPAQIICCWDGGGIQFGVWIYYSFQFAGLGNRPTWYVQANNGPWAPSGSDPSIPYTWPKSLGFEIIATPTSGHSSLSVEIVINNLS